MPVALHPNQLSLYVLREDRELSPEKQTRFKIRALSPTTYFGIVRDAKDFAETIQAATPKAPIESLEPAEEKDAPAVPESLEWTRPYADRVMALLKIGLGGWENFKDADGKDVPFDCNMAGEPIDTTLARLPWWSLVELSEAVMAANVNPTARLGN